MAPSTSPASPEEAFAAPLARFYRWHAPIYDWTRPFILFGRGDLLRGLDVEAGHHVLDVGCGTGWGFPRLLATGARLTGIEPCDGMRARAARRAARLGASDRVEMCAAPFGIDGRYRGTADRVVLSYSLSMIPAADAVIDAAFASLRPGGRIGVVDFLDAAPLADRWLAASHVRLGTDRLTRLQRRFPIHRTVILRAGLWRYYLFWGEAALSAA